MTGCSKIKMLIQAVGILRWKISRKEQEELNRCALWDSSSSKAAGQSWTKPDSRLPSQLYECRSPCSPATSLFLLQVVTSYAKTTRVAASHWALAVVSGSCPGKEVSFKSPVVPAPRGVEGKRRRGGTLPLPLPLSRAARRDRREGSWRGEHSASLQSNAGAVLL